MNRKQHISKIIGETGDVQDFCRGVATIKVLKDPYKIIERLENSGYTVESFEPLFSGCLYEFFLFRANN